MTTALLPSEMVPQVRPNRTKVEHYGWTVKDSRGVYRDIHKSQLNIDPSYQREEIRNDKILEYARDWSWVACGVLIVFRRPDHSHWIVDGQHRKLAADKRADITELPCIVFDIDCVPAEADHFLTVNGHRVAIRSPDKFKAMVVRGDDVAVAVKAMVEADGYRVAKSGQFTVGCITTIVRNFQMNEAVARDVWKICVSLHANGESIHERVWGGLFYLEDFLRRKGKPGNNTLLVKHNLQGLLKLGRDVLLKKIAEASAYYSAGGAKVYASGLVAALNHKRKSNRLPDPLGYGPDGAEK